MWWNSIRYIVYCRNLYSHSFVNPANCVFCMQCFVCPTVLNVTTTFHLENVQIRDGHAWHRKDYFVTATKSLPITDNTNKNKDKRTTATTWFGSRFGSDFLAECVLTEFYACGRFVQNRLDWIRFSARIIPSNYWAQNRAVALVLKRTINSVFQMRNSRGELLLLAARYPHRYINQWLIARNAI